MIKRIYAGAGLFIETNRTRMIKNCVAGRYSSGLKGFKLASCVKIMAGLYCLCQAAPFSELAFAGGLQNRPGAHEQERLKI
jgi:hypothetical protein